MYVYDRGVGHPLVVWDANGLYDQARLLLNPYLALGECRLIWLY
jgi:hypothetical protein